LGNIAEGWKHLRKSATSALTNFKPGKSTNLPTAGEIDDGFYMPSLGWSMLGGDIFEDDDRLVVRVEVPGIPKEDINIEVSERTLVISGEKQFERESSQGRWRIMQCAYGNFRREVPLPVEVITDNAHASYKNGVLRVELPKANPGIPKGVRIQVN
jgi:HSP20 family protein